MALESVLFNKTLAIKKLHPQEIESQAQHTDSCILNLVGHRVNSLPGHEHLAEEVD